MKLQYVTERLIHVVHKENIFTYAVFTWGNIEAG